MFKYWYLLHRSLCKADGSTYVSENVIVVVIVRKLTARFQLANKFHQAVSRKLSIRSTYLCGWKEKNKSNETMQ